MCDEDYYEPERLEEQAVRKLVEAHREEYDELTGRYREERTRQLEAQIFDLGRQLANLRGQNPDGTNVPALEQTANMLVEANDKLRAENQKLTNKLAKVERELANIRKSLAGVDWSGEVEV